MARTTPELVTGIVDIRPGKSLTPFISVAGILVDRIAEHTLSPSDEILAEIETWLSAHFYCIYDPRRVSERAGDVWATFMSKVDLNLSLTHYGQSAMILDTTGTLKDLNSTRAKMVRTIGVHYVGTDYE